MKSCVVGAVLVLLLLVTSPVLAAVESTSANNAFSRNQVKANNGIASPLPNSATSNGNNDDDDDDNNILPDIIATIGNTPLVDLSRIVIYYGIESLRWPNTRWVEKRSHRPRNHITSCRGRSIESWTDCCGIDEWQCGNSSCDCVFHLGASLCGRREQGKFERTVNHDESSRTYSRSCRSSTAHRKSIGASIGKRKQPKSRNPWTHFESINNL